MKFQGRGLLLDIEGTTSSVRFVYDVMFPYVRERLNDFLHRKLDSDDVQQALQVLSVEAGHDSFDAWRALHRDQSRAELVGAEVVRLMDADAKTTGLKQLQGLIWEDGFRSGTLVAHVYDEVPEQLRRWASEGWDIRIYSSGSRHAQLLFFGHTTAGDLLHLFRGHYDTTIGGKKSAGSYAKIVEDFALPPDQILFVSDIPAELDAATEAGLATALSVRPENADVGETQHAVVRSFAELNIELTA